MPRARAFDEVTAVESAMRHFWQHGYTATSVRDLGEAMGLGQASFYNAFGGKRALFALCLDRYLDSGMREKIVRLESELPPREAIETFLAEIVSRSLRDRRGCLLVNTALEVAPHDRAIGRLIAARLAELEEFFGRCVKAGQRAGTIVSLRDPADLARLFVSVVMGLRVLARARPEPALLEGAACEAIAALDALWSPAPGSAAPDAPAIKRRAAGRTQGTRAGAPGSRGR